MVYFESVLFPVFFLSVSSYMSDSDIKVAVRGITAGIKDLQVCGTEQSNELLYPRTEFGDTEDSVQSCRCCCRRDFLLDVIT